LTISFKELRVVASETIIGKFKAMNVFVIMLLEEGHRRLKIIIAHPREHVGRFILAIVVKIL
jgi:hypothetical protein